MSSKLKKIRNFIRFILKVFIINCLNQILVKIKFYLLPSIPLFSLFSKIKYSPKTSSFYFENIKNNNKFNTLRIDSSDFFTILCKSGRSFHTDKSPFNFFAHRHSYTCFYDILFSRYRDDKFNFAEIGVFKNNSFKMFRKYFNKAKLYGFDFEKNYLEKAKKEKLKNTVYLHIDVRKDLNIYKTFLRTNKKFKIIIDDSTHTFEDQIRIIKNCHHFLESKGILVIEDVFHHKDLEVKYYNSLKNYKKYFQNIFMVETNHINKFSKNQNNDKLLVLIKK